MGAAVVALTFSGAAYAASPNFDWAGPHLGVNVGGGSGPAAVGYNGDFFTDLTSLQIEIPSNDPFATSGFIGGAQAGYDWQHGAVVFGIEGDIDLSGIGGTARNWSGGTNVDATSHLDWVGTFRARLGYAIDKLLIYGTGGVAIAGNTLTLTATGNHPGIAKDTQTHVGWSFGVGAEYALSKQWSIGGELRHLDLGSKTYSDNTTNPGATNVVNLTDDLFLAKVNFHW